MSLIIDEALLKFTPGSTCFRKVSALLALLRPYPSPRPRDPRDLATARPRSRDTFNFSDFS